MFEIKYLAGAFIISCCVMANAREVSFFAMIIPREIVWVEQLMR